VNPFITLGVLLSPTLILGAFNPTFILVVLVNPTLTVLYQRYISESYPHLSVLGSGNTSLLNLVLILILAAMSCVSNT
jgi:hypothetical protein